MICLRRVAVRALPLPSTSIASRLRPITTLTSSITRLNKQPCFLPPLQKRFANNEATQTEEGENATSTEPVKSADEEGGSSIVESIKSAPGALYDKVSDAFGSVSGSVDNAAQEAATGYSPDQELQPQSTTVFVGNLYFHLQQSDLVQAFEKVGPVVSAKIITDPSGQSRGFAYVEFQDYATAQRAVEECHMQNLEGRQMNVQLQNQRVPRPRPVYERSRTLFIGNMPYDMSDRDLNNLFSKIKNIVDVRVAIDRRTGQPRGFAHADFVDEESAEQGMLKLRDMEISGRTLRIDYSGGPKAPNQVT